MLFYTHELTDALKERFDDIDEISDVARYGCSGGVSGFIYHTECAEFFDAHEDSIEDVCYDMLGDDWIVSLVKTFPHTMSILGLKTAAVWFVVGLTVRLLCKRLRRQFPPELAILSSSTSGCYLTQTHSHFTRQGRSNARN